MTVHFSNSNRLSAL